MLYYIPPKQKMGSGPSANILTTIKYTDNLMEISQCHQYGTSSHKTGSLTYWGQTNAIRPSATAPAAMKQVHLQAESRQMPQDHQHQHLQPWNRFTYILRCHKTISNSTCSHETGSLTLWEQANATRPSGQAPAAMKQVHLLSGSRHTYNDQPEDLQLYITESHTFWYQRKMSMTLSKWSYNYCSRPPTSYR